MSIAIGKAVNAYRDALKGTKPAASGKGERQEPDFAGMLKTSVKSAIDGQKQAEKLSMAAVAGKADINQVITAVAEAEVTLQAVVAVRDKVIEAYKDIIRMPI